MSFTLYHLPFPHISPVKQDKVSKKFIKSQELFKKI